IAKWPLIALGQKLWLRYFGTRTDGSTYTSQTYDATPVPGAGLPNGMYPNTPVAQLRSLKDGSQLRIEFKVTFDGNTDERQAVIFPSRLYTVKALVETRPEITSVKGASNGAEIANGSLTVETSVVLTGTASKGQKVDVLDGTVSKGQPTADATTGIWTLTVSGLAVAAHSFTAKALYGAGTPSAARTFTVTAVVAPTISSVKGSPSGAEIPNASLTIETSVVLTGTASKGQKVDVLDGTVSKGQPTADATTGIWTLTVSGLAVAAHSFTAKALYGAGSSSAARTFTVTAVIAPTISSVKGSPSGAEIPNGTLTIETSVVLTGMANKGLQVDVLDGSVSKGQPFANITTGVWTVTVSGLSVGSHSFTVKLISGSIPPSAARQFSIIPPYTKPTITTVVRIDTGAHVPSGSTVPRTTQLRVTGGCYSHPTRSRDISFSGSNNHQGITTVPPGNSSYFILEFGSPVNAGYATYQAIDYLSGLSSQTSWGINWS
ncbi:hypothetical protein ACQKP4_13780, partial [Pseudomonas sp. NPDC086278]